MHPAVLEFKRQLQERYGDRLARFLVFGSYARGENTSESDIDVFVTLKGNVDRKIEDEIFDIFFKIELEYDVILDVKVFSEDELQNTVLGSMPLVEQVNAEGIPI